MSFCVYSNNKLTVLLILLSFEVNLDIGPGKKLNSPKRSYPRKKSTLILISSLEKKIILSAIKTD